MDNEQTVEEPITSEQTTVSMDTVVEPAINPEYSHIPEKFMIDGEPDYTKMADSYKNLEGKLGTRVADAASDIAEYDYVPEGLQVTNQEQLDGFKQIALDQGLSSDQFQSMVDQYVAMNPSTEVGSADDYAYDFSISYEDDAVNAFKEDAMKMGISPDQYKGLMEHYEKEVSQFMPSAEKTESSLKEAWGNQYDSNLNSAFAAIKNLDGIEVSDVKGNPAAIKLLAMLGNDMQEDSSPNSTPAAYTGISKLDVETLMQREDYFSNKEVQSQVSAYFANKNR